MRIGQIRNGEDSLSSFYAARLKGYFADLRHGDVSLICDSCGRIFRMWYMPLDAGTMLALKDSNVSSSLLDRVNGVEHDAEPRVILSDFRVEMRSSSYVAVEVRVENSGTGYLWGQGASDRFSDFIGLRIFDGTTLLGEPQIHFYHRMLLPGESVNLRNFFSFPDLFGANIERARNAKDLRIEVDLVRGGACRLAERGASNGPLSMGFELAPQSSPALLSLPLDIHRIASDKPMVALTFDGGSNARGTPELLDVLRSCRSEDYSRLAC